MGGFKGDNRDGNQHTDRNLHSIMGGFIRAMIRPNDRVFIAFTFHFGWIKRLAPNTYINYIH